MSKIKDESLNLRQLDIIRRKKTELPNSGEYNNFAGKGSFLCRACGRALFRTEAKFSSSCGWPSFDIEIAGAVKTIIDADGLRKEILCANCEAHLGHVFDGEKFTQLNRRYCVNSLSLDFVENTKILDTEEAIIAGGCFWGVEHYIKLLDGIEKTEVGYIGGKTREPCYEDICQGNTGHFEALRVIYSPSEITYQELLKYFFEIHDPTQESGQGPDIGQQYKSAIFFYDQEQRQIAEKLIFELKSKGFAVQTILKPVSTFWKAENYHQDYYHKTGKQPYCHSYVKRF